MTNPSILTDSPTVPADRGSPPGTGPVVGSTASARFTTAARWAAAAAIVVPIALNAVSHLFDPLTGDTAARLVADAAAHPGATAATAVVKALLPLAAGGALALAWLARRSALLALTAGAVLFMSYLGSAWFLLDYVSAPLAVGRGPAASSFVGALDASTAAGIAFALGPLAMLVGDLLLGAALLRSHAAPRWVGIGFVVFAIANVGSHLPDDTMRWVGLFQAAVWAYFTVVSAGAAQAYLRSSKTAA